jgi:hypothetical protein
VFCLACGLLCNSSMSRALLRLSIVLPFAVLSLGACGGSAFEGAPSGLGAGGAGTGGSGSGVSGSGAVAGSGASTEGGTVGFGGASTGGTTSIGGSITAGGAGNVGGAIGLGGSAGSDIQACTSNTDCEVVPASCCSCGIGPISDYTSINSQYDAQYSRRCQTADLACGPCPLIPADPNAAKFYYVPTCQSGRCAVADLRATDITACATAADCSLRGGTACCPGCDAQPVALNTKNEPELSQLVCGTESVACSGCASPAPYSSYSVGCTEGRCSVELAPCTAASPCAD